MLWTSNRVYKAHAFHVHWVTCMHQRDWRSCSCMCMLGPANTKACSFRSFQGCDLPIRGAWQGANYDDFRGCCLTGTSQYETSTSFAVLDALLDALEARAAQAGHHANADLVKLQVRPLVTETMRLQADAHMRDVVKQLKVGFRG